MTSNLLDLLDFSPRAEGAEPRPLEFDGDPLAEVPVVLRLICGCQSAVREDEFVIDDVAAVLQKSRTEVQKVFRDENADRGGLVDALRFAALREASEPFHELADRALIMFIGDQPAPALVERLIARLRPILAETSRVGPLSPLKRANQIAAARSTLLVALAGGTLESRLGRSWTPSAVGWIAKRLVQIAEVAKGDLDYEISLTKYDMEEAKSAANKAQDELDGLALNTGSGSEKPDEEVIEDNDDTANEGAEQEALVVLRRLPIAAGSDAKKLMEPFKGLVNRALPLVVTPDLAAVRATLVAELPHLRTVIDAVLTTMSPFKTVRNPPTLFVGPPGCGKTTLAERLMQELGVPFATYDGAGSADAMALGSSRKWSNAAPGLLLDLLVRNEVANPGVVIDELEKVGGSDRNGDLRTSLLGLFEPRRAASFLDRHLEVPVDYSRVIWFGTANTMDGIPLPLANRMRVLKCPAPGREHLDVLAPQLMKAALASRGMNDRWYQPLTQMELDALRRHWRGGSIRNLRRLLEGILAAREQEKLPN